MNRKPRIVRNGANTTRISGVRIVHLLAVVSPTDSGLERAFIFLRVFVRAHHLAGVCQFALIEQARLRCLEHQAEPVSVLVGYVPELVEGVLALRSANEDGPSLAVAKSWANDLRPDGRVHVAELVEDRPVQVNTSKTIRIVSTVDANAGAVVREFNP